MITEIRLYTINRGKLDWWLSVFRERVIPTSAQYGVHIHAAWVNRRQNEVIWVRSYESAEQLDAYNKSPERAAYIETTSPHVAKIEVREVEGVLGDLPIANK